MKPLFCSTVTKTSRESFLGLQFWAPPHGAVIILVNVHEQGLFAGKLKVGMQIDRINGQNCRDRTIADMEAYLDGLVGPVTIWASAPQANALFEPKSSSSYYSGSISPSDATETSSLYNELSLESLTLADSSSSSSNW